MIILVKVILLGTRWNIPTPNLNSLLMIILLISGSSEDFEIITESGSSDEVK